jgi:signal transduction histidine kinase
MVRKNKSSLRSSLPSSSPSSPSSSLNIQFGKYDTLIKYTLIPSIPLSIIAILCVNLNAWVLSEIHHFYIELFAVILAAILSFYYIARAHTLDDKFSLFIGIGFLANALIDLLHVVVSFAYMDEFMFLKYFIPQTWFAGRIFLSAMFAIAIVEYPLLSRTSSSSSSSTSNKSIANTAESQEERQEKEGQGSASLSSSTAFQSEKEESPAVDKRREIQKMPKIIFGYLVALTIVCAYIAISSLFVVFPGSVIDDFPLHRPYEILALGLFLLALIYFYKNQLYKKSDVFYKGILVALIIDIFGQIIMSYSATSFDTPHNVAHVLKDAGYFVNIVGLALSSIQYNSRLKETNRSLIESNARLKESNARLKEREEIISTQYEKLKEADKMKDEFINVAAHELRTPIQPILGMTELLHSKIKDNAEQRELLDITIRNVKRLKRLANEILDVAKIESQYLQLKKEEFNLNDIIVNCVNDITINRYSNNKREKDGVKISYEPKDIFLEADEKRISQVISNLLSNALKATNKGFISIISNTSGDSNNNNDDKMAIISVRDTGQGIAPDILPKLFSKFFSKSFEGTGLGLYISKRIVEGHGGKIWAENNFDGKGATFSFTLPLNTQQLNIRRQQKQVYIS